AEQRGLRPDTREPFLGAQQLRRLEPARADVARAVHPRLRRQRQLGVGVHPLRIVRREHVRLDPVRRQLARELERPVYAVAAGEVYRSPDAVAVRGADGREFSYWHVEPAVEEHEHVEEHELLGWAKASWGHVHFAELEDGVYVNPLRPGALEPYVD